MLKPGFKTFLNYTPAISWGIFLSIATLTPSNDVPGFLKNFNDKLIHTGIYFLLTSLIFLANLRYKLKNQQSTTFLILVLLFIVLYGGLIEILQHYLVAGRTGDLADFMANFTGSLLSVLLFYSIQKRRVA